MCNVPPIDDDTVSILELGVGADDRGDPEEVLDSCSSSCLILLFINSTSGAEGMLTGVDTFVRLLPDESIGAWLEIVDPLPELEPLAGGVKRGVSKGSWAELSSVAWPCCLCQF